MMRVWRLSDDGWLPVLSVAYIGPKSRTERPRKTKLGTEVAHVIRDSDTTFKVKRSKVNLQGAGAYWSGLPHSSFMVNRNYNILRRNSSLDSTNSAAAQRYCIQDDAVYRVRGSAGVERATCRRLGAPLAGPRCPWRTSLQSGSFSPDWPPVRPLTAPCRATQSAGTTQIKRRPSPAIFALVFQQTAVCPLHPHPASTHSPAH